MTGPEHGTHPKHPQSHLRNEGTTGALNLRCGILQPAPRKNVHWRKGHDPQTCTLPKTNIDPDVKFPWNTIFLYQPRVFRFHVLPGCNDWGPIFLRFQFRVDGKRFFCSHSPCSPSGFPTDGPCRFDSEWEMTLQKSGSVPVPKLRSTNSGSESSKGSPMEAPAHH